MVFSLHKKALRSTERGLREVQVGARDTRVKSPFTCGPVLSGGVARVRALLPLSESLAPPAARGAGPGARMAHTLYLKKKHRDI